jgi:hypothetical protein
MVDFEKILNKNINHSMILDRNGVIKAMVECYNLGVEHSTIKFNKLKNTFKDVSESEKNLIREQSGLVEDGE